LLGKQCLFATVAWEGGCANFAEKVFFRSGKDLSCNRNSAFAMTAVFPAMVDGLGACVGGADFLTL
jgi:hypothetical protein